MRDLNIVIVGQQPWDTELGSNCKDIALEFSKQNNVLYVNTPLDRFTSFSQRRAPNVRMRLNVVHGKTDGLQRLNERLWILYPDCIVESINWIDNAFVFDAINRVNNKRFAQVIKRYLIQLGFDSFILFNDNEIMRCFYLNDLLKPRMSIYYSRDFIVAAPYWNKHGTRLEPIVIKRSTACVANSIYLERYCKQYNNNTHYIGQGFDQSLFNNKDHCPPEELREIRRPIIGYVGVLHSSRLDIELIQNIACKRHDWSLVLVGPEDDDFKKSKLHKMPNVHFLGFREQKNLPKYISAFDVCINPQFLTPLTIGNYPRKVDEYLAMGKPVVALQTHAMQLFAEVAYLANDTEEFILMIEKALSEDSERMAANRIAFAEQHSWERSVDAIYEIISNH